MFKATNESSWMGYLAFEVGLLFGGGGASPLGLRTTVQWGRWNPLPSMVSDAALMQSPC